MFDLLVRNGRIIDGTGAPAFAADLGVADGRIVAIDAVGAFGSASAAEVIDATGRVVTPGFVDIHTHSDLSLISAPSAVSAVRQGVTTCIVGNCGLGVVPTPRDPVARSRLRAESAISYLDLDAAVVWDWESLDEYLERLERRAVHVGALVGHLALRAAVCSTDRPGLTEVDRMGDLLNEALGSGAFGLSTGLNYAPLTTATDAELTALARIIARHDALFAWHLEDYADGLLPAVERCLRIARAAACRVQISHLVSVGERNWGAVEQALALVETARADGLDVAVDVYPYTAGNCPLSQLLPSWAQEAGMGGLATSDHGARARIKDDWLERAVGWDQVTLSRLPTGADAPVGATISAIAHAHKTAAPDVALDLLARHGPKVMVTVGGRSDLDVRRVLEHEAGMVASDGQAIDPAGATGAGMPHPRSYGCFPRALSRYVSANLSREELVRKCTQAPALRMGLHDRGVIEPGRLADLAVWDPEQIKSDASYSFPQLLPNGIGDVVIAGVPVVRGNNQTEARPGNVIRMATTQPEESGVSHPGSDPQ